MATNRSQKPLVLLLVGFVLLHGFALIHGWRNPGIRTTADSRDYLRMAYNLVHYGTAYSGSIHGEINPALFSRRPPAYPLFLAAALWWSWNPVWALLLQIGLNLVGAVLLWKISGLPGIRCPQAFRILVAALYLLLPAQLIYTHTIMAEVLLQVSLLAAFYGAALLAEDGSWKSALLLNVGLAVAVLTKPVMLYFWIPNLAFGGWVAARRYRPLLAVVFLLPLMTITLWSVRNWCHTGFYHFSSMRFTAMALLSRSEDPVKQSGNRGEDQFAERSRTAERRFFEYRLQNWTRTLFLYGRGFTSFFLDPGRFDIAQFFGLPDDVRLSRVRNLSDLPGKLAAIQPGVLVYMGFLGVFNAFVAFSFLLFLFRSEWPLEGRVFLAMLVVYVALVTGMLGASRYRLAVTPLLFLTLPGFLSWLKQNLQRQRER